MYVRLLGETCAQLRLGFAAVTVVCALATGAAAEEGRSSGRIEEIVVTAQKRETNLQDTPLAVSAFSGADLDTAGALEIEDLTFVVPNLHYGRTQGGPQGPGGITIRGISSAGGDRSTAFHVDGVYINAGAAAEVLTFFDVERVEVLRGPQGTLYGRNATGGAVNVISKPPTEEFEAFGDIQLGNFDQIRSRAVLNAPLIGDRAFARLSLVQEDRDGFQRNLTTDRRSQDADDARDFGARGQMLFRPIEDVSLTVRGTYSHRGGVGVANRIIGDYPSEIFLQPDQPVGLDLYNDSEASPNPTNPRHVRADFIGNRDETQWNVNAQLSWELPELPLLGATELTAIASYSKRDDERVVDSDLADIPLLSVGFDDEVAEIVSEVRLSSVDSDHLEWVAGVFYLDSEEDLTIGGRSLPFSLVNPAFEITTEQLTQRDDRSFAVFGQATYTLFDDWRLTGGLRYSYDEKNATFDQPPVFLLPGDEMPFIPGTASVDRVTWDEVTGKVGVDWQLFDDHMLYAAVSRGYKAGVINTAPRLDQSTGLPTGDSLPNADPEIIWSYEAGAKNLFFDNRLQLNLTGFYYDYQDLQVTVVVENTFATQNAAEATVWGFELETMARPVPELLLIANASYLNAEYDQFIGFREEDRFQLPADFSGNQLTRAPRYSVNLAAQYDFDIGKWGVVSPRVQFYASDDVFFRSANDRTDKQDNYTKTDVRLGWQSEGGALSVAGFIDNVNNQDVIQSQIVGTSLVGWPLTTALDEPRTMGVRVAYRFQ